ncbi:MAG: zinc-dependent metalloprotease [Rikenellaceae bacterium]|nr:zinc-dependent metalloprotease [Rikenellaceae bacterium]
MKKLRTVLLLLTVIFLFDSCIQDVNDHSGKQASDALLSEHTRIIASWGFDVSDLYQLEEFYVVEGDLLFPKDSISVMAQTRQYYAKNRLVDPIHVHDIKLWIDPQMSTNSLFDWRSSIRQAIVEWNSIPECLVYMRIVSSEEEADIKIRTRTLPAGTIGMATFPSGGRPGSVLYLTDAAYYSESQKIFTVVHELGHALGLYHTDSSQFEVILNGLVLIPGTPDSDSKSIMNSYLRLWAGFSEFDIVAMQYLYPMPIRYMTMSYISEFSLDQIDFDLDGREVEIEYRPVSVSDQVFGQGVSHALAFINQEISESESPFRILDLTIPEQANGWGKMIFTTGVYSTGMEMILEIATQNFPFRIIQSPISRKYEIENQDKLKIYPGTVFDIVLNGSTAGITYYLTRAGEVVTSKSGHGGKLIFSGAYGPGTYKIRENDRQLSGARTVYSASVFEHPYFQVNRNASHMIVDGDGGIFSFTIPTTELMDVEEVRQICADYNAGKVSYWPAEYYRLEVSAHTDQACEFTITCAPNPGVEVDLETHFKARWGDRECTIYIYQDEEGEVGIFELSRSANGDGSRNILLSGSQHLVKYRLYKDQQLVTTLEGKGNPLTFTHLPLGNYSIYAECRGRSFKMKGEVTD